MELDSKLFNSGDRGAQRVMFYMGTLKDGDASLAAGRPVYKDTPFIRIFTAGDNLHIHDVPVWDEPENLLSHTGRFPQEWAKFKAGIAADEQSSGTPLKHMPGISAAQVRELEHFHVKTVEQLAEMADEHASKFMGIQALKSKARQFILVTKGEAPLLMVKAELQQRDDQIAALRAQVEQLIQLRGGAPLPAAELNQEERADVGTAAPKGSTKPAKKGRATAGA